MLPPYRKELSEKARRQLERLGVDVRTGARVTRVGPEGVDVEGAGRIDACTVLWGAGVAASTLGASLGAPPAAAPGAAGETGTPPGPATS